MTKTIKWRLTKLPSVEELRDLVKDKILTNEEAREILFNLEDEEERDKKSLESEIKFLRALVEKLSHSKSEIITTIREIQVPYAKQPWYTPYYTWCSADTSVGGGTVYTSASSLMSLSDQLNKDNSVTTYSSTTDVDKGFSSISTF